jgi:hypothetical protein
MSGLFYNAGNIRTALGASRSKVIGLVIKEAARLVVVGVGIGIAGSLLLAHTAASLLFGLSPATR